MTISIERPRRAEVKVSTTALPVNAYSATGHLRVPESTSVDLGDGTALDVTLERGVLTVNRYPAACFYDRTIVRTKAETSTKSVELDDDRIRQFRQARAFTSGAAFGQIALALVRHMEARQLVTGDELTHPAWCDVEQCEGSIRDFLADELDATFLYHQSKQVDVDFYLYEYDVQVTLLQHIVDCEGMSLEPHLVLDVWEDDGVNRLQGVLTFDAEQIGRPAPEAFAGDLEETVDDLLRRFPPEWLA
ncbi:hypothetical protein [Micromonospora sp. NPDC005652]|uniref:hypothetical protein n=1 Tax=Micromonospora sp. NPDC005652 TaxID=3157046 RepID=UPI0033FD1F34